MKVFLPPNQQPFAGEANDLYRDIFAELRRRISVKVPPEVLYYTLMSVVVQLGLGMTLEPEEIAGTVVQIGTGLCVLGTEAEKQKIQQDVADMLTGVAPRLPDQGKGKGSN